MRWRAGWYPEADYNEGDLVNYAGRSYLAQWDVPGSEAPELSFGDGGTKVTDSSASSGASQSLAYPSGADASCTLLLMLTVLGTDPNAVVLPPGFTAVAGTRQGNGTFNQLLATYPLANDTIKSPVVIPAQPGRYAGVLLALRNLNPNQSGAQALARSHYNAPLVHYLNGSDAYLISALSTDTPTVDGNLSPVPRVGSQQAQVRVAAGGNFLVSWLGWGYAYGADYNIVDPDYGGTSYDGTQSGIAGLATTALLPQQPYGPSTNSAWARVS